MTSKTSRIEIQFGLAHDCIRACVYSNYIARKKSTKVAWLSLMDTCYADAVITWNQLFGTNSQQAHWKAFTHSVALPTGTKLKPFGKNIICDYLKITEVQWASYHAAMVQTRNSCLAHFDHQADHAELPELTWALHSAFLYRAWLLELLKEYQSQGHDILIDETSGDLLLKQLEQQISEVCT